MRIWARCALGDCGRCWSRWAPAAVWMRGAGPIWSLQAHRRGGLVVALCSGGTPAVWGCNLVEAQVDLGLLRGSGCPG